MNIGSWDTFQKGTHALNGNHTPPVASQFTSKGTATLPSLRPKTRECSMGSFRYVGFENMPYQLPVVHPRP